MKASNRNITNSRFTISVVLLGWPPASMISIHMPCIRPSVAGTIRIVRIRNVKKALPGDACMNLAKGPRTRCFCHLVPSCVIQNAMKSTIINRKGIRNTINQNAIIGFLPVRIMQTQFNRPIKASISALTSKADICKIVYLCGTRRVRGE